MAETAQENTEVSMMPSHDEEEDRATGTVSSEEEERSSKKLEVWLWYLYELCSYFINATLLPVLFPLLISQIFKLPPEPPGGWDISRKGFSCGEKQMKLYGAVTYRSIAAKNTKFTPLEWTSISWGIGLVLAAATLPSISFHFDYGHNQFLIAAAAIGFGGFFCLHTGFFHVAWIFPLYISAIVVASTVATLSHTRQLTHIIQAYTGPSLKKHRFRLRRRVSSWLSLYATAAGCLGSSIISSFIYHMLRRLKDSGVVNLWVVSIFSGLIWLVGISHTISIKPCSDSASPVSPLPHFLSILMYPHAFGSVIVSLLSSFTSMCIFSSTLLYLMGEICLNPVSILYFWLLYHLFPLFSLPLMQILQQILKANGVKMHLLGYFLSILTAGFGFYFRTKIWSREHVLIFAAVQSTSVGLLHAFGRVLVVDCSPVGKEGAFSAWFSWGRNLGTCIGFAVATAIPGNVSTAFGVAFCTAVAGGSLLIYGNISDLGGALAAGNVIGEKNIEESSQLKALENAEIAKCEHLETGTSHGNEVK